MATIVYLDVDDEITSAAARIRDPMELRVALVLPHASRISTSRINFRLLAREARLHSRRLGIVAPDASTRALAASAGLPVFHSVGEYEASLDAPDAATEPGTSTAPPPPDGLRGGAPLRAVRGSPDDGGATLIIPAVAAIDDMPTVAAPTPGRPASPAIDETPTVVVRPGSDPATDRGTRDLTTSTPITTATDATARRRPGAATDRRGRILALGLLAAGVAGFVFLPSATVRIAPRIDPSARSRSTSSPIPRRPRSTWSMASSPP